MNWILAFSLISTFAYGQQQCPKMKESPRYNINQKFFALGSDFEVVSEEASAGKVIEKILTWGRTFELRNEKNELVAKAKQKVFSFGVKIDVYDCQEKLIGSINEDILRSLFRVYTVYSVLDSQGQKVGVSNKLDWFRTEISFLNSQNQMVALLKRRYLNFFTDKWELNINTQVQPSLDSRLLFFAAAYKSSSDRQRRAEEDARNDDDRNQPVEP